MILWWLMFLVFHAGAGIPALAESEPSGVGWDQLTSQEQRILQPFQDRWAEIPPSRQLRLQHGARRWAGLTPAERHRMRERFERWQELPQDRKEEIRERFKRFRQLPPEKRQALKEKRHWFKNLPPERRQELRQRWMDMNPQERRKFRRQFDLGRPHHRPVVPRPIPPPRARSHPPRPGR